MKLLYVQRVGQFIAKLILNKHQRALVTNFDKYALDDLGKPEASEEGNATALLQSTIQEDGSVSDFAAFAELEGLTEEQE